MAQLGRARAYKGAHRAALHTLVLATVAEWDLSVFVTCRESSLQVSDSIIARTMAARISVAFGARTARRLSLNAASVSQIGEGARAQLVANARRGLSTRVMAGANRRALPNSTTRALHGGHTPLRSLLTTQKTVFVI